MFLQSFVGIILFTVANGAPACKNNEAPIVVGGDQNGPLFSCECLPPLGLGYTFTPFSFHSGSYKDAICMNVCNSKQSPVNPADHKQTCACPKGQIVLNGKCAVPPAANPNCGYQGPPTGSCPACAPGALKSWQLTYGSPSNVCSCASGNVASAGAYGVTLQYCDLPFCTSGQALVTSTKSLTCRCGQPGDYSWQQTSDLKCVHLAVCTENQVVYKTNKGNGDIIVSPDQLCYCSGGKRSISAAQTCVTLKDCQSGAVPYDNNGHSLCYCDNYDSYPYPTQATQYDQVTGITKCVTLPPCTDPTKPSIVSGIEGTCYCNPATQVNVSNNDGTSTCYNLPHRV